MSKDDRDYSNGEIIVHWRPELCVHCQACIQGLPQVFDLAKRPWVSMDGATTDEIKAQVGACPSGALTCSEVSE